MDAVVAGLRKAAPKRVKTFERATGKARYEDHLKAFRRLTTTVDGEVRLASDPPVLVPLRDLLDDTERDDTFVEWLRQRLQEYRVTLPDDRHLLLERYRLGDFARKVVGVGSVGTRCWFALMLGRDDDDPPTRTSATSTR